MPGRTAGPYPPLVEDNRERDRCPPEYAYSNNNDLSNKADRPQGLEHISLQAAGSDRRLDAHAACRQSAVKWTVQATKSPILSFRTPGPKDADRSLYQRAQR